jgi:class 3 adenylate cyclase/pimeloyl-ACP methyl ester carboxylesterase
MERRLSAVMVADMVGYSRLMEADEGAVLALHRQNRADLIDPAISQHGGKIVKTTGDGMIVEFSGAQDAVLCGLDIQQELHNQASLGANKIHIQYRIGINVGDIVFDDGDIFGDGVNVAARLEAMTEPGGLCISDPVYQIVRTQIAAPFKDLGSQSVKNISRPIRVWQWTPNQPMEPDIPDAAQSQSVSFCISSDGTQLAWARVGEGPKVVKAPNWLNHLEYEWRSPSRGPVWAEMAKHCDLVRFDQRGNGLSDRDPKEMSQETMLSDMESVVDAAQLDRFFLFGISQGCAFSVDYAAKHPERVLGLVLVNGYARGALKRNSPQQVALHEATNTLISQGWGSSDPSFRHLFTETMMPDASTEQKSSFDEMQRVAVAPEIAAELNTMNAAVDVSDRARTLSVPTLVLHCEGDRRVPLEEGRRLAALIPGALFKVLPGNNHALIEGTAAFDQFFEEFAAFLEQHSPN